MHDQDGSHAMTRPEIEELVEGFAQAARRAKEAGFDGCEIMAAYNALFEQFWSPFSNRRDDAYRGASGRRLSRLALSLRGAGAVVRPGGSALSSARRPAARSDPALRRAARPCPRSR